MHVYEKYLKEVEKKVDSPKNSEKAKFIKNYMNSKLNFVGLSVPAQRKIYLEGFSFSSKTHAEQSKIWLFIWKNSKTFEVMAMSLYFYDYLKKAKALSVKDWPKLKQYVLDCENWAHSDMLSNFYSDLLEENFNKIFPTIQLWNLSKDPWKKRQSMVSLNYYSQMRKRHIPFKASIALIKRHIKDPHYYVQKGVGWSLRELYNVYPLKTYDWLTKNITLLSSHAFSSSTEKLSLKQKAPLKVARVMSKQKS